MIERLTGRLAAVDTDGAVIDVGGVGFRMEMSRTTLRSLPEVGGEAAVLTHLHVREEALQLFGFSTAEERDLFLRLISVSKIGPRLALAALSIRSPRDVRRAIAAGDVALFQSVPGIGKKTAERLILELREKMLELEGPVTSGVGGATDGGNLVLARAALAELGMTAAEAEHVLRDADPETSVDQLVRAALRKR
ncbi:MAG: Holliday junction branch migration protein RuvA [Thermoleophilia bacterium]